MKEVKFSTEEIERKFQEAASTLLLTKANISAIRYVNFNHKNFDANNQRLLEKVSGKSIVYCIWVGKSKKTFLPKYIGHSKGSKARQRLRAHLAYKSKGTGAKLDNVKEALKLKQFIAISIVVIEPAYMRKALEEWLLSEYSETLEWNKSMKKNDKNGTKR
jgi:hypothetical protein